MDKSTNKKENNCTLRLGVDDAGRGCVLGEMFLGGVLINEEQ